MDKKVQSAMDLIKLGGLLPAGAKVLNDAVVAMRDETTSRAMLKKHATTITKLVIPLLQQSSIDILDASKSLGPIPSVNYAQKRAQNKRKRESKAKTTLMTQEEENIFFYLDDKRQNNADITPDDSTPPRKKLRRNIVTPSPPKTNTDIPDIDCAFDRAEAAKILSTTHANTKERGALMRKIAKHQKKFGVPCHERTLQRLMKQFDAGKLIYGDFVHGRPPIATDREIAEAVAHFQKHNGGSLTKDEVKHIICKARNDRLEAAGFKVIIADDVSDQSVANYTAYIAIQPGISIAETTTVKTSTRFAAENSIRGSISLLAIIASTHFIPVKKNDPELRKLVKELSKTHPEVVMLMNMVSDALGTAVFPILPQYIYSTDDTTEYIYEGTKHSTPKFVLTTKKSISEKGTKSVHRVEDNKSMCGMRVKLTFTFSAVGTCFPLVVTVTGLTDRELPNGEDFVHVEVPGLCIGGGGVNVENQGIGHVLFMKDNEGAEKKRFEWYQNEILVKGVNDHRKKFNEHDASTSKECPVNLTACSWCDGDLSQIHAITNGAKELTKHNIIANKQHAARSAVEQPADLSKVFMLIKKHLPHHTVKNLSLDMCPMKKLLTEAFDGVLHCVNMPSGKRRHLIDFLCCLPDILNRSCTQQNIRQGFIEAGMIDQESMRFPVFDKILATCRRNPLQTEYDHIKSNFGAFFEAARKDGLISEQLFDELSIVGDKDSRGNNVSRDNGISQESRQRSKCLTHHQQRKLREERLKLLKLEANKAKQVLNQKHQELIDLADEAEQQLLRHLGDANGVEEAK